MAPDNNNGSKWRLQITPGTLILFASQTIGLVAFIANDHATLTKLGTEHKNLDEFVQRMDVNGTRAANLLQQRVTVEEGHGTRQDQAIATNQDAIRRLELRDTEFMGRMDLVLQQVQRINERSDKIVQVLDHLYEVVSKQK